MKRTKLVPVIVTAFTIIVGTNLPRASMTPTRISDKLLNPTLDPTQNDLRDDIESTSAKHLSKNDCIKRIEKILGDKEVIPYVEQDRAIMKVASEAIFYTIRPKQVKPEMRVIFNYLYDQLSSWSDERGIQQDNMKRVIPFLWKRRDLADKLGRGKATDELLQTIEEDFSNLAIIGETPANMICISTLFKEYSDYLQKNNIPSDRSRQDWARTLTKWATKLHHITRPHAQCSSIEQLMDNARSNPEQLANHFPIMAAYQLGILDQSTIPPSPPGIYAECAWRQIKRKLKTTNDEHATSLVICQAMASPEPFKKQPLITLSGSHKLKAPNKNAAIFYSKSNLRSTIEISRNALVFFGDLRDMPTNTPDQFAEAAIKILRCIEDIETECPKDQ
ncbi:MAG: hypothetical protein LBF70_02820 [Holosporales bacterium]|jgi:hypothetical protein|nr:hypothetical protein [Holosporales bacterium]